MPRGGTTSSSRTLQRPLMWLARRWTLPRRQSPAGRRPPWPAAAARWTPPRWQLSSRSSATNSCAPCTAPKRRLRRGREYQIRMTVSSPADLDRAGHKQRALHALRLISIAGRLAGGQCGPGW